MPFLSFREKVFYHTGKNFFKGDIIGNALTCLHPGLVIILP